jgi:flavin reductase (DIM6/NTAB) family NADH-FMN oxidoreductase RutF
LKTTHISLRASREFVVNIISEWFVESANHCSGLFPQGVDEAEMAGLTHVPSVKVSPPRIAESAFQMECVVSTGDNPALLNVTQQPLLPAVSAQLHDKVEVRNDAGKHTSTVVLGRVNTFRFISAELLSCYTD